MFREPDFEFFDNLENNEFNDQQMDFNENMLLSQDSMVMLSETPVEEEQEMEQIEEPVMSKREADYNPATC